MLHISSLVLSAALAQVGAQNVLDRLDWIINLTLWMTGFLCLLNIGLAITFRKGRKLEVLSYYLVLILELMVFSFALILHLRLINQVPFPLPPGLPVDRARIGAALALGIGLAPAAYWHRTNLSDLPERIARDAVVVKQRQKNMQSRNTTPGEWIN